MESNNNIESQNENVQDIPYPVLKLRDMNRAPLQSAQVNHNILDQAQPELKQADFISKI